MRRYEMANKTIEIMVEGGMVVEVRNVPEGWDYEIIDHDVEKCGG